MLRVGVIGLGRQNMKEHIPAVIHSDRVELVAVCDTQPSMIKAFQEQFSQTGAKAYTDVEKMLSKEKVDFVIVSVPHDEYLNVITMAAKKGIHIFKEKPFARSYSEAKAIEALVKTHRIQLMTAFQRRFHPLYVAFLDAIRQVGTVTHIVANYTISSKQPNSGWRGLKERAGGGVVIDMGYHLFDLLLWYFDCPDTVKAVMSNSRPGDYDVEDTATIEFTIGTIPGSALISCVYPEKREEIIVIGTNGSATLRHNRIERHNTAQELVDVLESPTGWNAAMMNQIDYFTRVISGEEELKYGNPHYQVENHTRVLSACYLSHESGKPVHVKTAHLDNV